MYINEDGVIKNAVNMANYSKEGIVQTTTALTQDSTKIPVVSAIYNAQTSASKIEENSYSADYKQAFFFARDFSYYYFKTVADVQDAMNTTDSDGSIYTYDNTSFPKTNTNTKTWSDYYKAYVEANGSTLYNGNSEPTFYYIDTSVTGTQYNVIRTFKTIDDSAVDDYGKSIDKIYSALRLYRLITVPVYSYNPVSHISYISGYRDIYEYYRTISNATYPIKPKFIFMPRSVDGLSSGELNAAYARQGLFVYRDNHNLLKPVTQSNTTNYGVTRSVADDGTVTLNGISTSTTAIVTYLGTLPNIFNMAGKTNWADNMKQGLAVKFFVTNGSISGITEADAKLYITASYALNNTTGIVTSSSIVIPIGSDTDFSVPLSKLLIGPTGANFQVILRCVAKGVSFSNFKFRPYVYCPQATEPTSPEIGSHNNVFFIPQFNMTCQDIPLFPNCKNYFGYTRGDYTYSNTNDKISYIQYQGTGASKEVYNKKYLFAIANISTRPRTSNELSKDISVYFKNGQVPASVKPYLITTSTTGQNILVNDPTDSTQPLSTVMMYTRYWLYTTGSSIAVDKDLLSCVETVGIHTDEYDGLEVADPEDDSITYTASINTTIASEVIGFTCTQKGVLAGDTAFAYMCTID